MSRKLPILSVTEFQNTRTFKKYAPGYYTERITLLGLADDEFYKNAIETLPFKQAYNSYNARRFGGGTQPTRDRDFSTENLNQLNRVWLKQFRPHFSASLVNVLTTRGSYRTLDNHAAVISSFMLNEFLAQDEFEVYHDFLNEKWDELFPLAEAFQIKEYAHTATVYKHYDGDSPFTIRPKLTRKNRMALECMTKDELLKIITSSKPESIATNNTPLYLTNKLKELNGESERQMSKQEATNQLMRAFSVALLAGGYHSNLRLTSVFEAITEIVQNINGARIANDSINYTVNQFTPNDLGKIGTFLEENGDKFSIAEMFFVIYSLQNHKLFTRTGTTADVAEIFLQFLEKDNALELFKMVGELGQAYSKQLPTITQWRKSLTNGDLDFVMSSEITVMLVSASDVDAAPISEVRLRRNLFGGSSI
jgi:hypothetical protein